MRKDIIGYGGLYEADSDGYILRKKREAKDKRDGFFLEEKVFKPQRNKMRDGSVGYDRVGLSGGNGSKLKCVHVLIYETFNDIKIPKGYVVDHLDGNKRNNRLDNLEMITSSENNLRAYDTGLKKSGFENPLCRIDMNDFNNLLSLIRNGYNDAFAARLSGISRDTVKKMKKGVSFKGMTMQTEIVKGLTKELVTKPVQVLSLLQPAIKIADMAIKIGRSMDRGMSL